MMKKINQLQQQINSESNNKTINHPFVHLSKQTLTNNNKKVIKLI